jgi:predicted NBD/HSP70 family sugar kinase
MVLDPGGATPGSLRKHNSALLMALIAGGTPVSRVDLARRTGLTKATVSSLVGELVDAGLVRDLGTEAGGAPGRPAGRLALDPYGPVGIGLQLATDHIAGCLMDLSGRVHARELRQVSAGLRPEQTVRAARPLLRRLFDHATTAGQLAAGVAVTIGGTISRDDDGYRSVAWAPELDWRSVDVLSLVAAELRALDLHGIDLSLDGEVAYAALAERRANPGPQWTNGYYVGGEAMIGAALLDGQGVERSAGLLGHLPVRGQGPRCACGGQGCLELYAGRNAMATAAGLPDPGPSRLLGRHPAEVPARVLETAADALAEAVISARLLINPATIFLGGRLAALGEPFRARVADRLDGNPHGTLDPIPVRLGRLGPDAALRGAAGTVAATVIADPLTWIDG